MTRLTLEIESLEEFDEHVRAGTSLNGWFIQSVDLTGRDHILAEVDPSGAVFLGCALTEQASDDLRGRGALIFPQLPDLPFDPYRGTLYDADELFGAGRYTDGADAAIYAWAKQPRTLSRTLAVTLHDHAISDALDEATQDLDPGQVVGVMGGHALARGDKGFIDAARLGLQLTQGSKTVLTGGGPGAMEAANLGAWMSAHPDALDEAIEILAEVPSFRPSLDDWAAAAMNVRLRWPDGAHSLGIPTWFYGHEPPNAFASAIAKYFTNALREDTLISRCRGGIVYLEGAAGTVQEIFQASTENYYAADDTEVAPMILVGTDYWTTQLPAWPLLKQLGDGRAMGRQIHLVDRIDDAAAILLGA